MHEMPCGDSMSHAAAAETVVGAAPGLALSVLTQQKWQKQGQKMVVRRRLQSRPLPRPVLRRRHGVSGRQRHWCAVSGMPHMHL